MCGITGWIDWQTDLSDQRNVVAKMAQTLTKRGPDDINVYADQRAVLGHTRLVVIDPEGGRQPMTKHKGDNQYTLVYNGELYNTEELRRELVQLGYKFRGHSDTEVLLTSYMHWGVDCLTHLNGIFAFAVWNRKEHTLFLARDRLGVKPLFYKQTPHGLIFGSELKALLAHPQISPRLSSEGLAEIFGLGPSRTPGHGIFQGIKELRPAHAMYVTQEQTNIYPYWKLTSKEHPHSLEETIKQIRHLVTDAITRQLVADVPVCSLLSGGLDSSAIAAIATSKLAKEGRGPLHTYSIDYQDNDRHFKSSDYQPDSDSPWAIKVAEGLGTFHHRLVISTDQLVEHLKEAVNVRDLPGMADVDSSLLWSCKQIRKQATVALSGECADEIFGGYPWFHRTELPESAGFPWMTSLAQRSNLLRAKWRKDLNLLDYVFYRYNQTLKEVPRLAGETREENRRRELFYLNMIWFMTTLLDRKDRMSMGASLEVRVPFADHRLVEYLWNTPWEMKSVDRREKGLLRRALQGVLPEEVIYRKKSPYPKTHNPLYTRAVVKWFRTMLRAQHPPILEFIEKQTLEEILSSGGNSITKPWFGQLMTGPQLIAYLAQVNYWLNTYNIQIV